jgi:hypothetical protein
VPPLHNLSSKVFSNLEAPLEIVNVLVCPPGTFFSESKEFRCTLLALAIEFQYHVVHSFHNLKNLKQLKKYQTDRGIYIHPANGTYHTSTTYEHINTYIHHIGIDKQIN